MSPRSVLVLGSGLIVTGIALIDFSWRRRKGAHSKHAF